jgi:molybdopterin-guanine dinucleotide biosynthesis protein A
MKSKIITSAVVDPKPSSIFKPLPKVTVTYDDGSSETLFTFYPDEISFTADEFIGKTKREANQLRHTKDVAYLKS